MTINLCPSMTQLVGPACPLLPLSKGRTSHSSVLARYASIYFGSSLVICEILNGHHDVGTCTTSTMYRFLTSEIQAGLEEITCTLEQDVGDIISPITEYLCCIFDHCISLCLVNSSILCSSF